MSAYQRRTKGKSSLARETVHDGDVAALSA
jgi:hypothetical protein